MFDGREEEVMWKGGRKAERRIYASCPALLFASAISLHALLVPAIYLSFYLHLIDIIFAQSFINRKILRFPCVRAVTHTSTLQSKSQVGGPHVVHLEFAGAVVDGFCDRRVLDNGIDLAYGPCEV